MKSWVLCSTVVILLLLGGIVGSWIADQQAKTSAERLTPCSGGVCSTSFWDYETPDPLCVIDPTCVSPFYSYDPGVRHFMGIRWWDISEDESLPTAWQALAPPNAILYFSIIVILAFTVAAEVRWDLAMLGLEAVITVACLKSVGSWFVSIDQLPSGHSFAVGLEQILIYGVAVALLMVSIIFGHKRRSRNLHMVFR